MMVIVLAPSWVDFNAEKLADCLARNEIQVVTELSGCKEVDGKKLYLAVLGCSIDAALLATNAELTDEKGNYLSMDLGLEIIANEHEPLDQEKLLPFFNDQFVGFDDDNNAIFEPVTNLVGLVPILAGKQWIY